MLFNVSGLIQEGIGAVRQHEVDADLLRDDCSRERVRGKVELLRTKAGVLVRAHLRATAHETCSRCLNPLDISVPIDFEEEFHATVDVRSGQDLDDDYADADTFRIDDQHILDITEAVRQYREASAFMQPLCREDCLGLCPECGQDLNLGSCDCAKGPLDSRWADLALLRPSSEGKD